MSDVNIQSGGTPPPQPATAKQALSMVAAPLSIASDIGTSIFNVHESRKNRRFQRDMSNTSHQREVKDLLAAGLNPVLSAKLGGSSSPVGGAAQIQAPGKDLSSAVQVAQLENINAQTNKTNAEATAIKQNIGQAHEMNPQLIQKILLEMQNMEYTGELTVAQSNVIKQKLKEMIANYPELFAKGELWSTTSDWFTPAGAAIAAEIGQYAPNLLKALFSMKGKGKSSAKSTKVGTDTRKVRVKTKDGGFDEETIIRDVFEEILSP